MSLKSEQWLPTELFCVERTNRKTDSQPDRQTDRRDVTKIIVAFAILQNRLKDLWTVIVHLSLGVAVAAATMCKSVYPIW